MSDADTAFLKAQETIKNVANTGASHLNFSDVDFVGLESLPPEISKLMGLDRLNLFNTKVTDLTPLADLTGLMHLDISNTKVTDLTPLAGLTGLQSLDISNTKVTDLTPLAGLMGLHNLTLVYTPINDFRPLGKLTNLRHLDISGTHISDLTPLAGLTGLLRLNLSATRLKNLKVVGTLTGLRSLRIAHNPIAHFTPLAGLTGLLDLELSNTKITDNDLAPLKLLTRLWNLRLDNTEVSDLTPLVGLKQLQTLTLHNTDVTDLRPIAMLKELASRGGAGLTFQNTPATKRDDWLKELAEIPDHVKRTRDTLSFLQSLPPWPQPYTPAANPDGSPSQPILGADPPQVKTAKAQITHLLRNPILTRLTAQKFAGLIKDELRGVPATNGNYLAEPLQTMLEFAEALEHLAPANEPATDPLEQAKLKLRIAQLEGLVARLTQQLRDETKAREAAEASAGMGEFVRGFKKSAGVATGTGVVVVGVPTAAVYFLGTANPLIQSFLTVLGHLPK